MYNVQRTLLRCKLHKANNQTLRVSKQRLTVAQVTDVSKETVRINHFPLRHRTPSKSLQTSSLRWIQTQKGN